jgi:hypothetical protein
MRQITVTYADGRKEHLVRPYVIFKDDIVRVECGDAFSEIVEDHDLPEELVDFMRNNQSIVVGDFVAAYVQDRHFGGRTVEPREIVVLVPPCDQDCESIPGETVFVSDDKLTLIQRLKDTDLPVKFLSVDDNRGNEFFMEVLYDGRVVIHVRNPAYQMFAEGKYVHSSAHE